MLTLVVHIKYDKDGLVKLTLKDSYKTKTGNFTCTRINNPTLSVSSPCL